MALMGEQPSDRRLDKSCQRQIEATGHECKAGAAEGGSWGLRWSCAAWRPEWGTARMKT